MAKKPKQSAGLLMYRRTSGAVEVFLVHPGGPYWSKKNEGSWTIPKGEYEPTEEPLSAAVREFQEETGFSPAEPFLSLGSIRQKSGKVVTAWAFEGDCNPDALVSNTCEIEWPPRSGKQLEIPEIDRGGWFSLDDARTFLRAEQSSLLDALMHKLSPSDHSGSL
ncbi:MAG TPA: NUDIX domain-containing protein [Acidobacteriaceae bacterium]|jgi:predicted NUDIX family NTP pyrophosphohydrolase